MTDVFHLIRKPVSEKNTDLIFEIKQKAQALYNTFPSSPSDADARMMALAKTNLEQAVMWAVKSITTG